MPEPVPAPPVGPEYPGGESNPSYRWAFMVFGFLFLLTLALGLLNFLGQYVKSKQWF